MTRMVVIDGPTLNELQLCHERQRAVMFALEDRTPLLVCIEEIEWDRRPEQTRALIKGFVAGGKEAGSHIAGYFNAVGAGLFDTVESPALA